MSDRPPVLQLLGPSTGGIRRHVVELADRMGERGWHCAVAGPPGVLDGIGHLDHAVDVPDGLAPGSLVAGRRALAAAARGVGVIHAHGLKAGWLAASLRPRPPLVVTVHNVVLSEVAGPAAPLLRRLEAALPARAGATIVVSAEMARRMVGAPGAKRVRVVAPVAPAPRPAVPVAEVRARLGAGPGQPLVVAVGRLHPQKGHDVLLAAAAILARHRPGVRVAIVGGGPSDDALARQRRQLGLGDVVALAGSSVGGADALAAADVVVLASRWEGWPLVVAEAVQLGRPVVATAVGGIPEMLVDGWSAWLVAPGAPAALAGALEEALADPATASLRAGRAQSDFAARYQPAALADAVEAVYLDVLGRP